MPVCAVTLQQGQHMLHLHFFACARLLHDIAHFPGIICVYFLISDAQCISEPFVLLCNVETDHRRSEA
jgi:hypothetical protein